MTEISFAAPFMFNGVTPVSKAKFERFQKDNPHTALTDLSQEYADYFGSLLGTKLDWIGTSSKNVSGKRWDTENWWKNYGIVSMSFMAPASFKGVPAVGTRFPDPDFGSRLDTHGHIGPWITSPNLNATTAFIAKNL